MSTPATRRHTLYAVGMILGPALLLIGDLDRAAAGDAVIFRWSLLLQLAMPFLLLAALGMVDALRPVADRTGLAGGLLAGFGLFVGAAMQGFFRTAHTAMEAVGQADAEAILAALTGPAYLFTTRVPGIAFPIGLSILAVALVATRRAPAFLGLLIAAGAVLFPVGRIGGLTWAVLASGGCLLLGLGGLGVRTLRGAGESPRRAAAAERLTA